MSKHYKAIDGQHRRLIAEGEGVKLVFDGRRVSERSTSYRKGQWVFYDGIPRNHGIGQVTRTGRGMVWVRFLNGQEYGCYPQFLRRVTRQERAIEIAKVALGV